MDIDQVIECAGKLSPSVQLLPKLLKLLADPDSSLADIIAIIKLDATLTAEIIRVSNSSFYGSAEACNSIDQAINRIGFQDVNKSKSKKTSTAFKPKKVVAPAKIAKQPAPAPEATRVTAPVKEVKAKPEKAVKKAKTAAKAETFDKMYKAEEAAPVKVAVIVNEENPLTNLSTKQIELIFSGDTVNWRALYGEDIYLRAYVPQEDSSIRKVFQEKIMNSRDFGPNTETLKNHDRTLEIVSEKENAIAMVKYPFYRTEGVKVIAVDGIPPKAINYALTNKLN